MSYCELQVTTHFSFLRGASSADELFARAAELGIETLGVVDRNSLAGIVRAWEAAKTTGVRLVVGCRLDLADGMSILVYPTDRPAYSRLTRLLSLGKSRGGKGKCILDLTDVATYNEGLIAILVPDEADDADDVYAQQLRKVAAIFGDRAYVSLCLRRRPNDRLRLHNLSNMAVRHKVKTVVTNDVLFHDPGRRQLQDIVTCIRNRTTIDDVGFDRERHADRFLKPPEEMHRLFPDYPEALDRTREIVARCRFDMSELQYQYPEEAIVPGLDAQQSLAKFTWEGAADRYPEGIPDKVRKAILHELELIRIMRYAPYFLTVYSIVRFARSKDILCQGRGSAANSAVCYCLGITSINPETGDLLFERFVSMERNEPPDIDVDFEHSRREEVIQWIYETYGRSRSALCSTVTRYRAKGALRDVGKALGLPEDLIGQLSSGIWGWSKEGVGEKQLRENNMNASDYRLQLALELAGQLMGAPRHLGQHPGGFVLTQDRLDDLVPIEPAAMDDRQVVEWDKDDIEALKFMKVDVLALGPSLKLERRQALWDIKAMRDEPLELWAAAAEREARTVSEVREPEVVLKSMAQGREVVEDYSHTGLTLRAHPLSFLRQDLKAKRIVTCAEAMGERDGRWLWTAGLVLVRQRPGSAKGVMFLTLEDETGIVNAVVWPSLFERQRRVLMTASMMGIHGRIQREGDVVHLVAQRLFDFSGDLASLGERDGAFPMPHGRGDQVRHGGGPDPRDNPKAAVQARDIYIPDLHIDTLKVKSRNFH